MNYTFQLQPAEWNTCILSAYSFDRRKSSGEKVERTNHTWQQLQFIIGHRWEAIVPVHCASHKSRKSQSLRTCLNLVHSSPVITSTTTLSEENFPLVTFIQSPVSTVLLNGAINLGTIYVAPITMLVSMWNKWSTQMPLLQSSESDHHTFVIYKNLYSVYNIWNTVFCIQYTISVALAPYLQYNCAEADGLLTLFSTFENIQHVWRHTVVAASLAVIVRNLSPCITDRCPQRHTALKPLNRLIFLVTV